MVHLQLSQLFKYPVPLRLHCMPAWSNRLNWGGGWIRLVELGGNPLRLHCMPAWLNRSNWGVSNSTSQIGWKSIEITLYAWLVKSVEFGGGGVELGGNPLRLHCMTAWSNWGDGLNSTGWIGWKSIEITLYACLVKSVELGGIEFDRSNWVEIHWDYIVCLPGQIHWDYIVCLPGRIGGGVKFDWVLK